MIQAIGLAVKGMTGMMDRQDQIANNLANVNTTGYKQSNVFLEAYQKYLNDDQLQVFANRDIETNKLYMDWRQGPALQTGNQLDAMIQGSGFFSVMTDQGVRYTRNGSFSLDSQGQLVTADGAKVMSREGGYIKLDLDKSVQVVISERGEVIQEDEIKGTLRVTDFPKPYQLVREGSGYYAPGSPEVSEAGSAGYIVRQECLEGSNVNIIKNMVDMVSSYRIYEADQRALLAHDQTLDKAVNQVGRVG